MTTALHLKRVLTASEHPLHAREIHTTAQTLAGEPLSWNTVKDCLHKSARDPNVPNQAGRPRRL